jgi:hypothetical protein
MLPLTVLKDLTVYSIWKILGPIKLVNMTRAYLRHKSSIIWFRFLQTVNQALSASQDLYHKQNKPNQTWNVSNKQTNKQTNALQFLWLTSHITVQQTINVLKTDPKWIQSQYLEHWYCGKEWCSWLPMRILVGRFHHFYRPQTPLGREEV